MVEDRVTGVLCRPENPHASAAALLDVVEGDGAIAQRMGDAGRTRAIAHFSLDACADACDELYRRM